MPDDGISRSTVILRVQNSAGVLSDPTTEMPDGSVAINAFIKGGVIDCKSPSFTIVRSNITAADSAFPAAGSGIALPRASQAVVDVHVTGDNPSCRIRPLSYNAVLNTYVAGETSDPITEPFRLLTPVASPEDFYIQIVECGPNTIVTVSVAGI